MTSDAAPKDARMRILSRLGKKTPPKRRRGPGKSEVVPFSEGAAPAEVDLDQGDAPWPIVLATASGTPNAARIRRMAADSHCLFRALAEGLMGIGRGAVGLSHQRMRKELVDYLSPHASQWEAVPHPLGDKSLIPQNTSLREYIGDAQALSFDAFKESVEKDPGETLSIEAALATRKGLAAVVLDCKEKRVEGFGNIQEAQDVIVLLRRAANTKHYDLLVMREPGFPHWMRSLVGRTF